MQNLHDFRANGLGGSDACVIANGVHFKKTKYMLWKEKVTGVEETKTNFAMAKGTRMEGTARAYFNDIMDCGVQPAQWVSPKRSWLRGNVDGYDPEKRMLVELKNPGKEDHSVAVNKKVPEKYYPQVQHYLALANEMGFNLDMGYYGSLYEDHMVIVDVPFDEKYVKDLLKEEEKFWEMVVTEKAPDLCDADYFDMDPSKLWRLKAANHLANKAKIDELQEDNERIKKELIEMANGSNCKGGGVCLQQQNGRSSIDYKLAISEYTQELKTKYPEIHFLPMDLEPYRKRSSPNWVVRAID